MKKMSQLTTLICLGILIISGCQQPKNQTEEETTEEAVETPAPQEKVLTDQDSAFMDALIADLKGIDQFFVTDSYKRLQAILIRNDHPEVSRVNEILENVSTSEPDYYLEDYMPENGYLSFTPGPIEVFVDMVYWNVSDGSQLIATQSRACGPVCDDMDISFERYANGSYEALENGIPAVRELSLILVPDLAELEKLDPFEFYFKLPIKGKDLNFCLEGGDCLLLKWNDGTFKLAE